MITKPNSFWSLLKTPMRIPAGMNLWFPVYKDRLLLTGLAVLHGCFHYQFI